MSSERVFDVRLTGPWSGSRRPSVCERGGRSRLLQRISGACGSPNVPTHTVETRRPSLSAGGWALSPVCLRAQRLWEAPRVRSTSARAGCGDGEPVCKRGSVVPSRARVTIHLCDPPEGCRADACTDPDRRAARPLCLILLRVGLTEPRGSLHVLVRSYRTVSPSPVTVTGPSAVCSLLHCPSRRRDLALASTLLWGAPTFLDTVAGEPTPSRGHPTDSPSAGSLGTPVDERRVSSWA